MLKSIAVSLIGLSFFRWRIRFLFARMIWKRNFCVAA